MEKLDRLGWAAGISFRAYGVRVGIRTTTSDVLPLIYPLLPPGWKPLSRPIVDYLYSFVVGGRGPASIRHFHIVYSGAVRLARTTDLSQALRLLELDLHFYVAERARYRVFVHAGVVGWQGRAIVIPGRTWSGKTSLVRSLVEAGASYYSDEFAVFDASGRVHPYPIALGIRDEHSGLPRKYSIAELGGTVGSRPLPVELIVFTQFQPGARWRPQLLTPGRTVLELLRHTLPARREPERVLKTLSVVASHATALKGDRGEARDLAVGLLEWLSRLKTCSPGAKKLVSSELLARSGRSSSLSP